MNLASIRALAMRHPGARLALAGLILGTFSAVLFLRKEHKDLEARNGRLLSTAHDRSRLGDETSITLAAAVEEASEKELQLQRELASELSAGRDTDAKIMEIEKALGLETGEQTLPLGSIESVAKRISHGLREMMRHLAPSPKGTPTAAFDASAFNDLMTTLPVIGETERRPEEIAQLQSTMIADFCGIDVSRNATLSEALRAGFAGLNSAGLSAPQKPTEESALPEWHRRRDEAIRAMAAKIAPLLPPSTRHREHLPGLLGIGEGTRTKVHLQADGHGSVSLYLPGLPYQL